MTSAPYSRGPTTIARVAGGGQRSAAAGGPVGGARNRVPSPAIMGSAKLSLFDVTGIVVGSIVGADIYVASAITAGMLGPCSILVWVVAGVFAAVVALNFAYCSYHVPKV